jgi:hypothetical protein
LQDIKEQPTKESSVDQQTEEKEDKPNDSTELDKKEDKPNDMTEVSDCQATIFNLFDISTALLNVMVFCQLVKAIDNLDCQFGISRIGDVFFLYGVSHNKNIHDSKTLHAAIGHANSNRDKNKPIKQAVCDRGYVGAKEVLGVKIILPKKALKRDNRYQCDKKRKLCKRRAAIEPIIGHLKSTLFRSHKPMILYKKIANLL